MTILLAVTGWDASAWRARLEALLPARPVVALGEPFDPAAIRYALSWAHPPGALAPLSNLELIFSLGAGVDHLFADPALPDRPIVRVVDSDLRDRMSEWVVMHALVHLRQLRRYERQQRERAWVHDEDQAKAAEIHVGVLGLGVLGMDAAAKLKALGFKVSGWSTTEKAAPGIECFRGAGGLDVLLSQSDILAVLLPLTATTRGMLNASLFAKLKKGGRMGGPVLINAGRGGLHVEADILAALDSGILKGASLDVFEREPLPASSRLWTHPAVYVSPHNAAISAPVAVAATIARQIEAFERGEPLRNVVDRKRGY
jgi:glyoxylate/hydroxypyruvate reductase